MRSPACLVNGNFVDRGSTHARDQTLTQPNNPLSLLQHTASNYVKLEARCTRTAIQNVQINKNDTKR